MPTNWRTVKLSDHFELGEFFYSKSYPREAALLIPTEHVLDDLYALCQLILEPLRKEYGPVVVLSGFRGVQLNQLVGGSKTSQHLRGKAVDVTCSKVRDMTSVYHWLAHSRQWPGEVILYPRSQFVHIGLPEFGVKADHLINKE